MSDWKDRISSRVEELTKKQEGWQKLQDDCEQKIDEIIGREITLAEFANLRQLFFDWEAYQKKVENLDDLIIEWRQSV